MPAERPIAAAVPASLSEFGQSGTVAVEVVRVRGVRSWATPHTKRVPLTDVLVVAPDRIEIRPLIGRRESYAPEELRRVAISSYLFLPLIRRRCLKLTFASGQVPMFFRPWRTRRLERALGEAGWKVAVGDPV